MPEAIGLGQSGGRDRAEGIIGQKGLGKIEEKVNRQRRTKRRKMRRMREELRLGGSGFLMNFSSFVRQGVDNFIGCCNHGAILSIFHRGNPNWGASTIRKAPGLSVMLCLPTLRF